MSAKEMFNRHQFFSTYKGYVKIKLMQNETNLWSIFFFGKDEILVKFRFKGLTFFTITDLKTDRFVASLRLKNEIGERQGSIWRLG